MSIDLTEEQRQAVVNGEAVRLRTPDGDIVVLRADEYEALRELLEDQAERKAFRDAGLRSAIRWMKDNPF